MIDVGALFFAVVANDYHTFNAASRASFSAITTSLAGFSLAQLAVGVLGVLLIAAPQPPSRRSSEPSASSPNTPC
jgi:ABC-2 type transport system permease protein